SHSIGLNIKLPLEQGSNAGLDVRIYSSGSNEAQKLFYGHTAFGDLTPHLRGLQDWKHLSAASSLCGGCTEACPVKIDLHHHLLQNRRNAAKEKPDFLEQSAYKIFGYLANRPALWSLAKKLGRFGQPFQNLVKGSALDPARVWTQTRDLPPLAKESFKDWWRKRK
ncbi:MAG: lactate utilization protein LutB domain-containing protein, partial [Verrucomicrobiota bacterium]